MGPKNGHMTQEVLIRAFPGFTHAQRKKQFSFYQGCKAGEDAHGSGWPCMLKHTGWRQVRPAVRGRERLVGQREEAGRRGAKRDQVLATRRALCLPSQPCAAWPGACSAKPTRAWGGTGLSCLPGYRLWDTLGAQWIFICSTRDDGWVSKWVWEQKESHRGNPLSPVSN